MRDYIQCLMYACIVLSLIDIINIILIIVVSQKKSECR